jgi:nucleoprotein TPR
LKKIRTVQAEADAEINRRKTVEAQLVAMKAEADNERQEWVEQKISLEEKLKETIDRLEEARGHNKVLHDQMATLTASVDKLQNERIINLSETSGDATTEGVDGSDELNTLRKSVSELREVVQFMRSEREMFEAQTETARRTAERERASSTILKRNLEEARTELNLLQVSISKNDTGANTVAVEKELKVMEDQLRLLRESNQLLREDSEKVSSKLVEAHSEAEKTKKSLEPVQTRCRILEVDKAALETEKSSLTRELDAWKARVQSLVSRFHQVGYGIFVSRILFSSQPFFLPWHNPKLIIPFQLYCSNRLTPRITIKW